MLLHTLLISPVERLLLAQGSSGPCVPPIPRHSKATTGKPLLHRHSCPAPCEYLVELCQMGASRACRKDTNAGVPPPGLAPETCMSHSGYSQTWACSRVQTKRKQITALGSLLCISSCFARKRHSILRSH